MKKKNIFSILAVSILLISMLLTSCGSTNTLESYVNSDKDLKKQIKEIGDTNGLTVEIKGNDVIYIFDLSTLGVTDELIKGNELKDSLEEALTGQSATFKSIVSTLEDETKINDIRIIVNYIYKGDTIVTKSFEN
ncbi:MAG: DUF4854 domain-containing protein [Clostridiales bacterium]|nr:DUF4854 domain-containing protein [Clostridiales bacterium]